MNKRAQLADLNEKLAMQQMKETNEENSDMEQLRISIDNTGKLLFDQVT